MENKSTYIENHPWIKNILWLKACFPLLCPSLLLTSQSNQQSRSIRGEPKALNTLSVTLKPIATWTWGVLWSCYVYTKWLTLDNLIHLGVIIEKWCCRSQRYKPWPLKRGSMWNSQLKLPHLCLISIIRDTLSQWLSLASTPRLYQFESQGQE